MTPETIPLEEMANYFQVHPRTILRAVEGRHNVHWHDALNKDPVNVTKVAQAYGLTRERLVEVINGENCLLTATEVAFVTGYTDRTMRHYLQTKIPNDWGKVKCGGIVRYLESRVNENITQLSG